ncbi:DUF6479 family protein [Streptomyces sp. NBC_00390]|uniref:DUF6479 family protein n=1 Tax=Streptomyces sp. NBC_00390 TaxID=2975736 RepID=UPI002E1D06E3
MGSAAHGHGEGTNVPTSSQALLSRAASNPVLGGIGLLIARIVTVAVLIGVIPCANRRRRTQPPRPRPEEQPTAPGHRTHIEHNREPVGASFPDAGSRLTRHELKPHSSRPGSEERRTHDQDSGAFGSGSLGGCAKEPAEEPCVH